MKSAVDASAVIATKDTDPGNDVFVAYRVPDPEAPYPQDYVIDQSGIVRYWSWEYDPQEVIATIDGLLGTSGAEDAADDDQTVLWFAPPAPNPCRPGTDLQFYLPVRAEVRLVVYDVTGRLVRSLLDEEVLAVGEHNITWDGTSQLGTPVASGIYFYRLRVGEVEVDRKLQIVR